MKLKYELTFVEIADEIAAVPVGDGAEEFHGIIKCNDSMKEMLELLAEETTEAQVTAGMLGIYPDVAREDMEGYVRTACATLREKGLLA